MAIDKGRVLAVLNGQRGADVHGGHMCLSKRTLRLADDTFFVLDTPFGGQNLVNLADDLRHFQWRNGFPRGALAGERDWRGGHNARVEERSGRAVVVAVRPIAPGHEIHLEYPDGYWYPDILSCTMPGGRSGGRMLCNRIRRFLPVYRFLAQHMDAQRRQNSAYVLTSAVALAQFWAPFLHFCAELRSDESGCHWLYLPDPERTDGADWHGDPVRLLEVYVRLVTDRILACGRTVAILSWALDPETNTDTSTEYTAALETIHQRIVGCPIYGPPPAPGHPPTVHPQSEPLAELCIDNSLRSCASQLVLHVVHPHSIAQSDTPHGGDKAVGGWSVDHWSAARGRRGDTVPDEIWRYHSHAPVTTAVIVSQPPDGGTSVSNPQQPGRYAVPPMPAAASSWRNPARAAAGFQRGSLASYDSYDGWVGAASGNRGPLADVFLHSGAPYASLAASFAAKDAANTALRRAAAKQATSSHASSAAHDGGGGGGGGEAHVSGPQNAGRLAVLALARTPFPFERLAAPGHSTVRGESNPLLALPLSVPLQATFPANAALTNPTPAGVHGSGAARGSATPIALEPLRSGTPCRDPRTGVQYDTCILRRSPSNGPPQPAHDASSFPAPAPAPAPARDRAPPQLLSTPLGVAAFSI
jgi:hypothetical protein